jgi:hypothetical protein
MGVGLGAVGALLGKYVGDMMGVGDVGALSHAQPGATALLVNGHTWMLNNVITYYGWLLANFPTSFLGGGDSGFHVEQGLVNSARKWARRSDGRSSLAGKSTTPLLRMHFVHAHYHYAAGAVSTLLRRRSNFDFGVRYVPRTV